MARVLIVDDDTDLLAGQQAFLEGKGYEVQTAVTIDSARVRPGPGGATTKSSFRSGPHAFRRA